MRDELPKPVAAFADRRLMLIRFQSAIIIPNRRTRRKQRAASSGVIHRRAFCGTNPVSAVKLRWHQRCFANATPDMPCAQSQRTICTKLPWVALNTAAKTRIKMEWRSRYGSANDMRSFLRSVSGASLIRIGVFTKNFEDPKLCLAVLPNALEKDNKKIPR